MDSDNFEKEQKWWSKFYMKKIRIKLEILKGTNKFLCNYSSS